eukprot:2629012-Prymnesium_polylepis.1
MEQRGSPSRQTAKESQDPVCEDSASVDGKRFGSCDYEMARVHAARRATVDHPHFDLKQHLGGLVLLAHYITDRCRSICGGRHEAELDATLHTVLIRLPEVFWQHAAHAAVHSGCFRRSRQFNDARVDRVQRRLHIDAETSDTRERWFGTEQVTVSTHRVA